MSVENVSYYENFNEIEKKLWALLIRAVNDRSSEFRTPVFICGDKNNLDGRVVVLRKADEKNLSLQFHSDIRSTKIDTLKKNPNSSLLFYGKKEKIPIPNHLYFICLPAIGVGIWLGNVGLNLQLTDVFVGLILIGAALLRYFTVIQRKVSKLFVDHNKLFHFLMGITHGITNLGGSLLTIYASALHEKKSTIRYYVAYYYFAFSSIQLILVFPHIASYSMFIHHMTLVIVSIIVYRLLGNTVFESATDKIYFHVFSLFMILCGITLLIK